MENRKCNKIKKSKQQWKILFLKKRKSKPVMEKHIQDVEKHYTNKTKQSKGDVKKILTRKIPVSQKKWGISNG